MIMNKNHPLKKLSLIIYDVLASESSTLKSCLSKAMHIEQMHDLSFQAEMVSRSLFGDNG
jgi:hypothetical protein